MKTIIIIFFSIFTTSAIGQPMEDTTYLKQQASAYLTKMYIKKQYDSASMMWDRRVFLEMADFYQKNQEHLTETILHNRVKADILKYYAQLDEYTIDKFLGATIEVEDGNKIGYVFFQYSQTLKGQRTTDKTMLVFISEDQGKKWVIQDWTVKWIADQVHNNEL